MAGERGFITLNFPAQVKSISSDCLSQVVTTSGQYSTNSNGNPYVFQCVLEEGYILSNVSFENNEGCSLRGFTDNTFTLDAELPHGINGSVNISVAEIQKSVSSKNLSRFLEKCDERYAKAGEGGTDVIANPTATGTEELTSLQVGETVYNVPATEITFSTEASADAIEVAGFSVANQSFKFPSGGTSGGAEVKGYSGIIFTNPQYGVRVSAIHADGSITVFEGDGGSVNVENVVRLIIAGELDGTNHRWCTPAEDSDGGGYKITYLGKGWSNYICYRNTTGSIFIEAVPTGNGFSFGTIMD